MAPLIENMSRHDVQWAKFKHSNMYNNIYYLRSTKFIVYQLATNFVNVVQGLGISALKQYNRLQQQDIVGFPSASIDTSDFVGSFAFNTFACVFMGLFFSAAVLFDVFWPERKETRCIQWTWKLGAFASSIFQLAAALAITIIVATHGVQIYGVSAEQEKIIREEWKGPPLAYHQEKRALATVVTCWIVWLLTFWSTIIMWRCYAHNNKYGPFIDHERRTCDGETLSMETGLGQV